MHPRSKDCHLIDFVITPFLNQQDHITRILSEAECSTNHRRGRSVMHLKIRKHGSKKQLKHAPFKDPSRVSELQAALATDTDPPAKRLGAPTGAEMTEE